MSLSTFCKVYVELGSMGEYYNKCNSDFAQKVNEIYKGPDFKFRDFEDYLFSQTNEDGTRY